MRAQPIAVRLLLPIVLLPVGCDLPGRPKPDPEVPRPEAVMSFDTLYGENCSGCHGADGKNGAAANLANPEYQAIVDDSSLREVIAKGEAGTMMPAFSKSAGGSLTDAQIEAILRGMRSRWQKQDSFAGQTPPMYKAPHPGDASKGQAVYAVACARCHGETAEKPGESGSILNGSFLALVNEQTVRTTIVAGRPDIGQPDWRGNISNRAMTEDEIANVSAWMMTQKPAAPGQPYPNARREKEVSEGMQTSAAKPGSH